MTATTHTTFSRKRTFAIAQSEFDYAKFSRDLNRFRARNNTTYLDIAMQTRLSVSLISCLCNNKYYSDLGVSAVIKLCNLMHKPVTNYTTT